ncbi:MAG: hypothetical protein II264_02545 [Ruminococcus sp.]|nr:hypothetical protein [Ruminococcus sp.]
MKWEPTDCKTGDMVRIRLGSIYHYGVFLSEDEVVQFGYPPIFNIIYHRGFLYCLHKLEHSRNGKAVSGVL